MSDDQRTLPYPKYWRCEVNFSENNSGGSWWLKQKDYDALAAAGWDIDGRRLSVRDPAEPDCPRSATLMVTVQAETERRACSIAEERAIESWEQATGYDSNEEGCNCCGPPYQIYCWSADECDVPPGETEDERVYPPALVDDRARHWDYDQAPQWVKDHVTLNGDDVDTVSLLPAGCNVRTDALRTDYYCTVMMVHHPTGLIVFGHHA